LASPATAFVTPLTTFSAGCTSRALERTHVRHCHILRAPDYSLRARMAKRHSSSSLRSAEQTALDRRQFLGALAVGAGAATMLGLGGGSALAQNAPPAGAGAGGPPPGGRPPPPPEPKFSQPAPLKEVAGKTAYITASSDGIGLGIARALSN